MNKKNGFNIMLFGFIMVLFMNLSCSEASKSENKGILLQIDREFSEMSIRNGMFNAFLHYIAEEGVILRDDSYPSRGRSELSTYYSVKSDTAFILRWDPLYEKISENGDMGYTFGVWFNTEKTTTKISQGTYVTVWQKQSDGSWKFVLDCGTQGLPGMD
jgi:ketosteroid isomerase-like protein